VFSGRRRLSYANQAHRFVAERPATYWEIIGDRLSKAGWSWGCVATVDSRGRKMFVADAYRGDGERFIVRADEKLTAFVELELAIRGLGELS
jgi:hypothetical protein